MAISPFFTGTKLPQYNEGMDLKTYHQQVGQAFNDVLDKINNLASQPSIKVAQYASAPANPNSGDIYYNTKTNVLNFYNGTEWVAL
jgi:hypothetical protein